MLVFTYTFSVEPLVYFPNLVPGVRRLRVRHQQHRIRDDLLRRGERGGGARGRRARQDDRPVPRHGRCSGEE